MEKSLDVGHTFKTQVKAGNPKFGLFVNSGSTVVVEQLSFSGYDWLLVDTQHGPMDRQGLSNMISAIANGGALSMVRVGSHKDREGIQQALDCGANGVLIPYVNNKKEVEEAVTCCLYPTKGTRSVYFPQRCTNERGLLGYVGNSNKNVVIAVQIETHDSIKNIDEILSIPEVDIAFLGQNDLCMSMGLFETYEYPKMYVSDELKVATQSLISAAQKYQKILGLFLFGTDRVQEFLKLGFRFISIGNDLHHVLTQTASHCGTLDKIVKEEKLDWTKRDTKLF
jgi:4-hydroxy-2-oxoheptanedioate aldolase